MSVLTTSDEGKFLMDETGDQIGLVTEVDADAQTARVEPEPDIADVLLQSLGYGDADDDDIEIPGDAVETVTDSELRVSRDL